MTGAVRWSIGDTSPLLPWCVPPAAAKVTTKRVNMIPDLQIHDLYTSPDETVRGYGDGDGKRYGDGFGIGYKDGNGDGYGNGNGIGDGSGRGYGNGIGRGYGIGYGDGNREPQSITVLERTQS